MDRLANALDGFRTLLKFDNRVQLLLNRLLFRSQSLVVYKSGGCEILIDHAGGDQNGTRDCLVTDMYSRYFSYLPQNRPLRVLDMGANGGGLLLSMKRHGFTFDTLACVEMNPATFARLHFNITQNVPACHRHLLNAAAYSADGSITLNLGKGGTNDSVHEQSTSRGQTVTIPTRSFDSLVHECFSGQIIDLCKIDIEGAEFEVILSSEATRLHDVRLLLIEIHPHPVRKPADILSAFAELGFKELCREQTTSDTCSVHLFENTRLAA